MNSQGLESMVQGLGFMILILGVQSLGLRRQLYTTLPSEDPSYYTRLL